MSSLSYCPGNGLVRINELLLIGPRMSPDIFNSYKCSVDRERMCSNEDVQDGRTATFS